MTIRLLHLADVHLDSPLPVPAGLERHQHATFDALSKAVGFAVKERVDAVLLAGDVYERRDRSVRARLHLQRELGRRHEAQIPSFLVHGNHDPLDDDALAGDAVGIALPPSTTVFGPQLSEVPVLRGGQVRFRVQGVSFDRVHVTENLALRFGRAGPEPTIGLLHCNVGLHPAHANYAPCTADDLDRAGLDYWALGHVHTRQTVVLPSGGVAAYPGNVQGRHLKELGARGALVVELDEHRRHPPRLQFLPCDVVRWHQIAVVMENIESFDALLEAAEVELLSLRRAGDPPLQLVALTLQGRTALHRQLTRPALNDLHEALNQRVRGSGWAIVSVESATRPPIDLSALAAAGGLTGALAEVLRAPPGSSVRTDVATLDVLEPLWAQLRAHGVTPPDLASPERFERAAALALDALLEAEG